MIRTRRFIGAGVVACAGLLSLPASGLAVTGATITDDAGQPAPLVNGMNLRNMTPLIQPTFAANERYFSFTITQPNGGGETIRCGNIASYTGNGLLPYKVGYTGSGTYTVTVKGFTQAQYDDNSCNGTGAGTYTAAFNLTPSISVGAFPTTVLTRNPSGRSISPAIAYPIPVNANPGADANELVVNGPGISPSGSVRQVDPATGAASYTFFEPGTYALTPRATDYGFAQGPVLGPAVQVRVLDPFDFSAPGFTDRTGPTYKWFGAVRTKYMPGTKLKFQIRRKGTKKFRTVSTAKVRKTRVIIFKMKIVKRAKYFYRISFKGNQNVAPGKAGGNFRVSYRRR